MKITSDFTLSDSQYVILLLKKGNTVDQVGIMDYYYGLHQFQAQASPDTKSDISF